VSRFGHFRLGETRDVVEVGSSGELREAVLALVGQGRRSVEIVSRHLDPAIYDTVELVEALKALVLASSRALVRVLVQDARPLVRDGHRLVALAQRLPTFLQLRVPAPAHKDFNQALLIVDETGYVHRQLADRYEGTTCFNGPLLARDLRRTFETLWASAEPDPNLRALRI
jgi:hypothetical protein